MMGSGIIMLPASMARIGSISLLSWLVSATGAMALAYSFAVASFLLPRQGGMFAYAQAAHGKSGFFMASYNYVFCLLVGNIAIAISAIGYLSGFMPWLSASPLNSCLGGIFILCLSTSANFWGARVTARFNAVTIWGVILPVASLGVFGWFWFDPQLFAASWNQSRDAPLTAVTSGISLTLWAFLGLESACAVSASVHKPRRNVPIAGLAGTACAALIYILSTSVIQGIVPNAELAASKAPFGLAFATLFSPWVGDLVSLLAIIACLGSLLGWQFTLGQVTRAVAEQGLLPRLFARVTRRDVPLCALLLLLALQIMIFLVTLSPNLLAQFGTVLALSVFNNLVPYILSLTAWSVIMQGRGIRGRVYAWNMLIVGFSVLYCLYAVYSIGKDGVFAGCLVMLSGYLVYGLRREKIAAP
jgi:putrescine:ornithine antiporter